jgi:hypothetical protein
VRLFAPARGAVITYFKKTPLVTLQWSGDENASSYTVEVARDTGFSDRVLNMRTQVNSIAVDTLPSGEYWWRVQAHYAAAPQNPPVSSPSYFPLEQVASAPPIDVPPTGTITTLQLEAQQVAVAWKGSPEYSQYKIELSKTSDFSDISYSENTSANFSRLKTDLEQDNYYWRIAAMDDQGTVLARSPAAAVEVRETRPAVLMTPALDVALVSDGESVNVAFSWNDPNRAGRARFELANDVNFLTLQRNNVLSGNSQVVSLPLGEYYWRVTILKPDGQNAAPTSQSQFFITAMLPAPILRTPVPGTVIDMRAENSIMFSWNQVPMANAYTLSLYQYDGNALQKRSEDRVYNTNFVYTMLKNLDRGRFIWEVEALVLENARVRTTSSPARSEFSIQLPELRKPAILSPQVIYAD